MEPTAKSVLPSGMRVVTEVMPHVRTASLGIWVGTGSRYEAPGVHGISHFLEHLVFKGTKTRSALDIAQAVDAVGGQMNAFTDREHTCFHVKVLATHLPAMVELMADMLLQSALDGDAIERERQVVTEEIKEYEDSPDELVQDLVVQTIWDGHPLGRSIIGTRRTVSKLTREDFVAYLAERYRPDNVLVSVAGNVAHDAVVSLIDKHLSGWDGRSPEQPTEPPVLSPIIDIRVKDSEQVHLCVATEGRAASADELYILDVLDTMLGGGMSSRLFHEIREKRGLVYSIASYTPTYREGGLFVIYAAMSPENGPAVVTLIFDEIAKLPGILTAAEVERAKESLKGNVMLGLESTASRMYKLARSELYHGRQIELDEIIRKIDAVTPEAVCRIASSIFAPHKMAMAAVGPFKAYADVRAALEHTFSECLGRLAPTPEAVAVPAV